MRRLILLRHAKAVPHGLVPDFDRTLTDRGREDARRMGAYMAQENLIPDLAAVSSAKRTRETWDIVSHDWKHRPPLRHEPRIYEASDRALLSLLRQTPDHVATMISVGHNPGFAELANSLVGFGDRYAFARMSQKFPTCSLVVLDFEAQSWNDIELKTGRLDRFITPATLGGEDE